MRTRCFNVCTETRTTLRGAPLLAVPSPKKLMLTWLADSSFNALCVTVDAAGEQA